MKKETLSEKAIRLHNLVAKMPQAENNNPDYPSASKEMHRHMRDNPVDSKSNALKHAELELDILCKSLPDPDNQPIVKEFIPEILALVDKFGKSGQSGGSAPFTAGAISNTIKKHCLFQSLTPIMGIDEEWTDVSQYGSPYDLMKYQNKRLSSVFKNEDGSAYYLDAIVWKNQKGTTWTGPANLPDGRILRCHGGIKSFPFTPKTFTVLVREEEPKPGYFDFFIDDMSQLDEVAEYYNLIYREPKQ